MYLQPGREQPERKRLLYQRVNDLSLGPQKGRGKDLFCDFINDGRLLQFSFRNPIIIPFALPWFYERWSLYTPFLYACFSTVAHTLYVVLGLIAIVFTRLCPNGCKKGVAGLCTSACVALRSYIPCCRPKSKPHDAYADSFEQMNADELVAAEGESTTARALPSLSAIISSNRLKGARTHVYNEVPLDSEVGSDDGIECIEGID